VTVLWLDDAIAAVSGEIAADARVVVAGASRLTDGTRVTLVTERAP
jgi:hypothetical protein